MKILRVTDGISPARSSALLDILSPKCSAKFEELIQTPIIIVQGVGRAEDEPLDGG